MAESGIIDKFRETFVQPSSSVLAVAGLAAGYVVHIHEAALDALVILALYIPIGAVAARLDPAVVSGPAVTTIVDLTGLILYFGITTHLLGIGMV